MDEPAPDLVCVGNLTVDTAIGPDGAAVTSGGGDALYAALAARLAGGRPRVLAPLGVDAPDPLVAALHLAGTDPAVLPRRRLPTVRNEVAYGPDGGRRWTLVTGEDHFEAMSVAPDDVPASVLAADGILLSAMALRAQLRLAAWLRPRTGAVLYFDPQEDYVAGHEAELCAAVGACDVFLPSEVEATALAGTADVAEAARRLRALGPRVVVVKLAERGCLVDGPDGQVTVPAAPVSVVDSTGAGDAFCGAFAAVHLAGGDPYAAAAAGAAVARAAVAGHGLDGLVAAVTETLPAAAGAVTPVPTITVINPNTSDALTAAITAAARSVAPPGVDVVGVRPTRGVGTVESHAAEAWAALGVVEQVQRHDAATDAFVVACFGDTGVDAAREVATGPVVGMTEAALQAACLLAHRFVVVTLPPRTVAHSERVVRALGLGHRCTVRAVEAAVAELEGGSAHLLNAFSAAVGTEDEAVVLGCAGLADLVDPLCAATGRPVVEGVAAAVGAAASLLAQGLTTARGGAYGRVPDLPAVDW